jgi:hypothetical protein
MWPDITRLNLSHEELLRSAGIDRTRITRESMRTARQIERDHEAPPDARLRAADLRLRVVGAHAPRAVAPKVSIGRITYKLDLGALLNRSEVIDITPTGSSSTAVTQESESQVGENAGDVA